MNQGYVAGTLRGGMAAKGMNGAGVTSPQLSQEVPLRDCATPLMIGMQDASDAIDGLHKAIANLEQRLSYVLRPEAGEAINESNVAQQFSSSPGFESLRNVVSRAYSAQARINALIDRLDC